MGNPATLRPKPFTSEHQPKKRRGRKGIPNRKTVLQKWLTTKLSVRNPTTGEQQKGTVEDEIILALISKARRGDVAAIREILDTMYGKLSNVNFNLSREELEKLSD